MISLGFVIAAMLEFAVVLMVSRIFYHPEENTHIDPLISRRVGSIGSTEVVTRNIMNNLLMPATNLGYSFTRIEKIDFVALITLSMAYIVFNCVYFSKFK